MFFSANLIKMLCIIWTYCEARQLNPPLKRCEPTRRNVGGRKPMWTTARERQQDEVLRAVSVQRREREILKRRCSLPPRPPTAHLPTNKAHLPALLNPRQPLSTSVPPRLPEPCRTFVVVAAWLLGRRGDLGTKCHTWHSDMLIPISRWRETRPRTAVSSPNVRRNVFFK